MQQGSGRPTRLHHTAYVSRDLEATRHFYEDLIGLPLTATWCEVDELFGKQRVYCHLFFGMPDGSALAFFQFAHADDQAEFGPALSPSPFRHIALKCDAVTQQQIKKRLDTAGLDGSRVYLLDHGYCLSLYAVDPDGMIVEFAVDAANADDEAEARQGRAHAELARWLAGDHRSNNNFRPEDQGHP